LYPQPTLLTFVVTGYFQQLLDQRLLELREKYCINEETFFYFNRTLVIAFTDDDYTICNEQVHISKPSNMELERLKSMKCNEEIIELQESMSILNTEETMKVTVQPILSNDAKEKMTTALSKETNMNHTWSLKCLNETDWDYDNALETFKYHFDLGEIPSEAFTE